MQNKCGGSASNAAAATSGFLPLKVNIAGVMPIIFAQAFLFIPQLQYCNYFRIVQHLAF
jgi:preprotein translocase subunit SecY